MFQIESSIKSAQVYRVSLVTVQTTDRTDDSLPYTLKKCQFYIFLSHTISSTHRFNLNPYEYTAQSEGALIICRSLVFIPPKMFNNYV